MACGVTTCSRHGETAFAFASQKGYLSLYGMKLSALAPLRDEFTATSQSR